MIVPTLVVVHLDAGICGDLDCRTFEVGVRIYETIPEDQFI